MPVLHSAFCPNRSQCGSAEAKSLAFEHQFCFHTGARGPPPVPNRLPATPDNRALNRAAREGAASTLVLDASRRARRQKIPARERRCIIWWGRKRERTLHAGSGVAKACVIVEDCSRSVPKENPADAAFTASSRFYFIGGVGERLKPPVLKTGAHTVGRGFESRPLRHPASRLAALRRIDRSCWRQAGCPPKLERRRADCALCLPYRKPVHTRSALCRTDHEPQAASPGPQCRNVRSHLKIPTLAAGDLYCFF